METHPHLHLFDHNEQWRYLVIGTFPPNTGIRDQQKTFVDYFYGNKGSLWRIIHDLYHPLGYDFLSGDKQENLLEIKRWQKDYCVGLSDTICSTARKHPLSSDDADFIDITYNHSLKAYVLQHAEYIRKIMFTSSFGKNSAYNNFRIIMGREISLVADRLITSLPSPSGSANIAFFNTWKEETLGLTDDFYDYIIRLRPDLIPGFQQRWRQKKLRRLATDKNLVGIPATPKGLVKEYKLWKYAQALPRDPCH